MKAWFLASLRVVFGPVGKDVHLSRDTSGRRRVVLGVSTHVACGIPPPHGHFVHSVSCNWCLHSSCLLLPDAGVRLDLPCLNTITAGVRGCDSE